MLISIAHIARNTRNAGREMTERIAKGTVSTALPVRPSVSRYRVAADKGVL